MDKLDQKKQINRKTFSAQFPGFVKDESYFQQLVIEKTNVEPHFVRPTEESMLESLDKISYHQEEPFGSASIAVQYEVFALAKQQGVTVLLDGQGADEILAGYHDYYFTFFDELYKRDRKMYNVQWNAYQKLHQYNKINPIQANNFSTILKKNIPAPLKSQIKNFYKRITNQDNPAGISKEFASAFKKQPTRYPTHYKDLNEHLYFSTRVFGLEQLLRYADRNSMAHSREVRLPFLSHELVEFLFTLPAEFKINNGWTKFLMRNAFNGFLPDEINWRKDKIGYEPPQQKWMQDKKLHQQLIGSIETLVSHGVLERKFSETLKEKDLAGLDSELGWKYLMAAKTLK